MYGQIYHLLIFESSHSDT
jgi:hypothetical protein